MNLPRRVSVLVISLVVLGVDCGWGKAIVAEAMGGRRRRFASHDPGGRRQGRRWTRLPKHRGIWSSRELSNFKKIPIGNRNCFAPPTASAGKASDDGTGLTTVGSKPKPLAETLARRQSSDPRVPVRNPSYPAAGNHARPTLDDKAQPVAHAGSNRPPPGGAAGPNENIQAPLAIPFSCCFPQTVYKGLPRVPPHATLVASGALDLRHRTLHSPRHPPLRLPNLVRTAKRAGAARRRSNGRTSRSRGTSKDFRHLVETSGRTSAWASRIPTLQSIGGAPINRRHRRLPIDDASRRETTAVAGKQFPPCSTGPQSKRDGDFGLPRTSSSIPQDTQELSSLGRRPSPSDGHAPLASILLQRHLRQFVQQTQATLPTDAGQRHQTHFVDFVNRVGVLASCRKPGIAAPESFALTARSACVASNLPSSPTHTGRNPTSSLRFLPPLRPWEVHASYLLHVVTVPAPSHRLHEIPRRPPPAAADKGAPSVARPSLGTHPKGTAAPVTTTATEPCPPCSPESQQDDLRAAGIASRSTSHVAGWNDDADKTTKVAGGFLEENREPSPSRPCTPSSFTSRASGVNEASGRQSHHAASSAPAVFHLWFVYILGAMAATAIAALGFWRWSGVAAHDDAMVYGTYPSAEWLLPKRWGGHKETAGRRRTHEPPQRRHSHQLSFAHQFRRQLTQSLLVTSPTASLHRKNARGNSLEESPRAMGLRAAHAVDNRPAHSQQYAVVRSILRGQSTSTPFLSSA
eukprot:GHVT01012241.1.p1 GENE.GHVT01012241.1~~GHVT01012241.1.p1  ORF type:complete len:753 (+),score=95.96 GHVT01012241.1:24-2261(+)